MAKKTVASLQKGEGRTYSKNHQNGEISQDRRLYLQRRNGAQRCSTGCPQIIEGNNIIKQQPERKFHFRSGCCFAPFAIYEKIRPGYTLLSTTGPVNSLISSTCSLSYHIAERIMPLSELTTNEIISSRYLLSGKVS